MICYNTEAKRKASVAAAKMRNGYRPILESMEIAKRIHANPVVSWVMFIQSKTYSMMVWCSS